jgi:hypothetical protein
MNQIVAIFKKDARHLWPEVLVILILTAALVRIYPHTWAPPEPSVIVLQQVAVALLFLVPMSWWILITRLIQSESLVGDRQFWLTRPYEWKKLLAAKALFLLAFLYLPLFIAHSLLLIEAGFHPLAYVPGLLYNLLLITAIIVLPPLAIATVTSGFAKTTLTILGILIGELGLIVLAAVLPSTHAKAPSDGGHLTLILFLCIFLSVILIQYAKRKLWLSRTILGGVALFGILAVLIPTDDHDIRKAYPQVTSTQLPVQLTFAPDETHKIALFGYDLKQKDVSLTLPFNVSGITAGKAISLDDTLISIDAPNGLHWTSHWQGAFGQYYLPSIPTTMISINVDRAFLDQVKSMPLSVSISLALTELQSSETGQVSLVEGDFTVPGIGICSLPHVDDSSVNSGFFSSAGPQCRSAMRQPPLAYVQTYWSKGRVCSDPQTQSPASADLFADTWLGSTDSAPADFSLAPISGVFMNLSNRFVALGQFPRPSPNEWWRLCPGTPLTITTYRPLTRTQTQITIPNLKIPPPARAEVGAAGGTFGSN